MMPYKDPAANRAYQQVWRDRNRRKIRAAQAARVARDPAKERERLDTYVQEHRAVVRTTKRRHKLRAYGLTPEAYERLVLIQSGRCAVCDDVPVGNLHVDHCHVTGAVRGLLCGGCNRALGILKEDPERITALAEYAAWHAKGVMPHEGRL